MVCLVGCRDYRRSRQVISDCHPFGDAIWNMDTGVVVGLSWESPSILILFLNSWRTGKAPAVDACLPLPIVNCCPQKDEGVKHALKPLRIEVDDTRYGY